MEHITELASIIQELTPTYDVATLKRDTIEHCTQIRLRHQIQGYFVDFEQACQTRNYTEMHEALDKVSGILSTLKQGIHAAELLHNHYTHCKE